ALEAAAGFAPGSAAWLRAQGQAIVAAAKHGRLDVVEEQVQLVGDAAPEAGALSAKIICLAWAATYFIFGGRHAAADALMTLITALVGDRSDIDLQAVALVHQVRGMRASASGDLGGCLNGFESAV